MSLTIQSRVSSSASLAFGREKRIELVDRRIAKALDADPRPGQDDEVVAALGQAPEDPPAAPFVHRPGVDARLVDLGLGIDRESWPCRPHPSAGPPRPASRPRPDQARPQIPRPREPRPPPRNDNPHGQANPESHHRPLMNSPSTRTLSNRTAYCLLPTAYCLLPTAYSPLRSLPRHLRKLPLRLADQRAAGIIGQERSDSRPGRGRRGPSSSSHSAARKTRRSA